jgi:hypothetical protein
MLTEFKSGDEVLLRAKVPKALRTYQGVRGTVAGKRIMPKARGGTEACYDVGFPNSLSQWIPGRLLKHAPKRAERR